MENHWQELWNNRTVNFDKLNSQDEDLLIMELKRIVGVDFYGKGSSITIDGIKKEYEYIKENLGLSDKTINRGGYLKLAAEAVLISTFSRKTALKSAAWITLRIWSLSQRKLSGRKIWSSAWQARR